MPVLTGAFVAAGATSVSVAMHGTVHASLGPSDGRTRFRLLYAADMSDNDPIRIGVTLTGSYRVGEGVISE